MSNNNNPFQARFILNPLYWPTWLGLGLLWLSSKLPLRVSLTLGTVLGTLSLITMTSRRRITRTNIRLCFPNLSKAEQARLLRQSFYSSGMALFESALAWWGTPEKLAPLIHIEGLEHIEQARQHGTGIILLGAHYTTIEMGGRIAAQYIPDHTPTYKRARNPLFEAVMTSARNKHHHDTIRSLNMRKVIQKLKQQNVIWYAPDQDFGTKSSVFAPFMGIQAATLTLTSRLAKTTNAPVLPWYCERLPNYQGYKLTIGPALENFPTGSNVLDATLTNEAIEHHVKHVPEQYLWGHRRFKTRPPGEPHVYEPRRDRSLRRYSRTLVLLSLPALFYTALLAYRNKDKRYFMQRLGIYTGKPQPVDIWFHAASVGEVNGIIPLIKALQPLYPDKQFLLTTFTPTGGAMAQKKLPDNVPHAYLPLDYVAAVKRFLQHFNPQCGFIMETELWPNLFEYCHNQARPLFIINGRLSEKTLRAKGWVRHLICRSIDYSQAVLARSQLDADRFKEHGAKEKKLSILGNIKFANLTAPISKPIKLKKPYVLLASSHDDEEWQIAKQWQEQNITSHILVIIPRHPHRKPQIVKQLQNLNTEVVIRSEQQQTTDTTCIYLADTFGEMDYFIAGAAFVIVAGSFVSVGGHNIMEVAAQGKGIIFGPHMHNFADERDLFLEHDAAVQVNNYTELQQQIDIWLQAPQQPDDMGEKAKQILQQQAGVFDDYLQHTQHLLETVSFDTDHNP